MITEKDGSVKQRNEKSIQQEGWGSTFFWKFTWAYTSRTSEKSLPPLDAEWKRGTRGEQLGMPPRRQRRGTERKPVSKTGG